MIGHIYKFIVQYVCHLIAIYYTEGIYHIYCRTSSVIRLNLFIGENQPKAKTKEKKERCQLRAGRSHVMNASHAQVILPIVSGVSYFVSFCTEPPNAIQFMGKSRNRPSKRSSIYVSFVCFVFQFDQIGRHEDVSGFYLFAHRNDRCC